MIAPFLPKSRVPPLQRVSFPAFCASTPRRPRARRRITPDRGSVPHKNKERIFAMGGRLEGKVALVAGAGRGIGKAIAIRFAAEGAKVLALSRTEKELVELVQAIEKSGACFLCVGTTPIALKMYIWGAMVPATRTGAAAGVGADAAGCTGRKRRGVNELRAPFFDHHPQKKAARRATSSPTSRRRPTSTPPSRPPPTATGRSTSSSSTPASSPSSASRA